MYSIAELMILLLTVLEMKSKLLYPLIRMLCMKAVNLHCCFHVSHQALSFYSVLF